MRREWGTLQLFLVLLSPPYMDFPSCITLILQQCHGRDPEVLRGAQTLESCASSRPAEGCNKTHTESISFYARLLLLSIRRTPSSSPCEVRRSDEFAGWGVRACVQHQRAFRYVRRAR